MRGLLNAPGGWQSYLQGRFDKAVNEKGEIVVQPHQVDGLSFPLTIAHLLPKLGLGDQKKINIVVMGGSSKGKQIK